MTKDGSTRLITISACLALLVAVIALTPTANATKAPAAIPADDASEKISTRPFVSLMSGAVVPAAGSQLIREKDAVSMTANTRGLTSGNVYSAWWVIFNNPENCFTRPCTPADINSNPAVQGSLVLAGARIAGPDGAVSYGAYLAVGDTAFLHVGPGLLDPKHAEIHIAVRSHGPASALDATQLAAALTSFNGGCAAGVPPGPNTCTTVQASPHAP
jgi:hypothetical protein